MIFTKVIKNDIDKFQEKSQLKNKSKTSLNRSFKVFSQLQIELFRIEWF